MIKNLVIVESPAKAKTIEKYLGAGFTVKSSMGHIRDLSKGDGAIDIEKGFIPKYEIASDKKELVKELKKLAAQAEVVWLATDEDREGEAISWHLADVLDLKNTLTHRIVFNEITKPAILNAIQNPRKIDNFLVDAQQARRILDRLVGYELSPVLWKKVKPQLSAGRVQSVAVRLVVDREREINDFQSKSDYRIHGAFQTLEGKTLKAEAKSRPDNGDGARSFLEALIGANFTVGNIEVKPTFRNPSPPFTTSTLQQEASRKLGYDVSRTMQLAQRLYENGHITYMRTDSVNLSQLAIGSAKNEITRMFGANYSSPRNYNTKSESAQEAHEAIRPTYFENLEAGDDAAQKKLYELIWKRAMASQMSRAELEKTTIAIGNDKNKELFEAQGEVVKFDGFLKLYMESRDDDDEEENSGLLPRVALGESLKMQQIQATQKYSRPAARYTEASLVKQLEELGIGRPSTYAPTISTVQKRGYVVNESRDGKKRSFEVLTLEKNQIQSQTKEENYGYEKNKLFPTDIGMLVTDFLTQNFTDIMDYGFTASVEKEFDEIAEGHKSWQKMLEGFYKPFHKMVEQTTETATRVTGERILGKDPKTGKTVSVRIGRFGPLVQIGSKEEGDETQFASLQRGQSIETISLEEALKLFGLPKEVAVHEGEPVVAGAGRFGPYLKYNGKYFSVPKGTDLLSLSEAEALEMLKTALNAPQFPIELGTFEGETLSVNKGRFGPYIKFGAAFVSIPRGTDAASLTLAQAIDLIKAKQESDKNAILRTFDDNADVQILKGRYGPYVSYKKKNIALPKDADPEKLTLAEILSIIEKAGDKAAPAKKAAAKKPGTRKK
ncbi:MAG: type I DNA topoisomerase [Bacteroidetes bacterium]|nr:type I DNA topoisomerase [Bacteroidota bacterium]MBS3914287.1 type I DNA topoisomerase [Bacteroidota bacterium]